MPCGGIWPLKPDHDYAKMHGNSAFDECFYCNKDIQPEDLMWCEEWDCYLHRDCVVPFLKTDEGLIVLKHGHIVVLYLEHTEDAKSE